ncbi:MAG: YWFCY domain-containing protein, partial [Bacteroidota bacterium]
MNTGENEQGLRKIVDMTRIISIVILSLHFYYYCYQAFALWGLTASLTNHLISNIKKTGLFNHFVISKLIALAFLSISLIGAIGKKEERLSYKNTFAYIMIGAVLYFGSGLLLLLQLDIQTATIIYTSVTSLGFMLFLT